MTVLRVAVLLCVFLIQRAVSQSCNCQSELYISIDDLVNALNKGPGIPGLIDNQNSCGCNQPSCGNQSSYGNRQSFGNQQSFDNQQSCGCNQQPCGCNQQPCGCSQQSCGCNQQPCGCNQQTCGCNQQPCGCNQQSCGCNQQSCGCNQQPCGCNQQSQSLSRPISIPQPLSISSIPLAFNNQCGCQPSVSISQPSQQCGCQPSISFNQPSQQCGCQPSISISQPSQQCGCQPSISISQPSCGCQPKQSLTISNPSFTFQPISGQPRNQGNQVSEICIVPAALLQAPPYGIIFAGDNLLIDGAVQVCGNLPFNSIVELGGAIPTSGTGCVQFVCDDCPC